MYKVTILTSLYNASEYLDVFLDNIVNQTIFNACQLYFMSGNSPEYRKEEEIISAYSFPNIKYIKLDSDPGIYGCWNKMIRDSQSEYITNANVDDGWAISFLEKHTDLLDKNLDIDVAYCYNIETNGYGFPYRLIEQAAHIYPTREFSIHNLLHANLPHCHPVWRRSLHNRFGYFEEEKYISGSDWDFWLRCALGGTQMKLIPEKLGIYYNNPNGVSTKKENMARNLKEVQDIHNHYKDIVLKLKRTL